LSILACFDGGDERENSVDAGLDHFKNVVSCAWRTIKQLPRIASFISWRDEVKPEVLATETTIFAVNGDDQEEVDPDHGTFLSFGTFPYTSRSLSVGTCYAADPQMPELRADIGAA
jgi:hypothetical protein